MNIEFVASAGAAEVLAVLVNEGRKLCGAGGQLDEAASGAWTRAGTASRFTGGPKTALIVAAPAGVEAQTVVLTGAGEAEKFDDLALEAAAGAAYQAVKLSGAKTLTIDAAHLTAHQAARAAFAARLASYRFLKYRTTLKPEKTPSIETIRVVAAHVAAARAAFDAFAAVTEAVEFSRDLVSEPSNVLYPAEFARRAKALEKLGLAVEILGESELEGLGFAPLAA